jgi:hypothetical protein
MAKPKDKINLLSRMVVFHEDAARLSEEFHGIIATLSEDAPEKAKARLKALIKNDFIDHFQFEESIVFPAVKAWARVAGSGSHYGPIVGYLEMHKKLLAEATRAFSAFDALGAAPAREAVSSVAEAFVKLSRELCDHARDEDGHILPLLKNNPVLRFVSSRRHLAKRGEATART